MLGTAPSSTQHPAASTQHSAPAPAPALAPSTKHKAPRSGLYPTVHSFPVSTNCVTDAELVARARTGDHAAFGDLVDRHRTAVYRAALAALRSHAEGEDAAQDTFVLAWRRLGSFRGDASFKTWLLTIAWHQAINRRRTLGRWWQRTAPLPEDSSYVASGFSKRWSPWKSRRGASTRWNRLTCRDWTSRRSRCPRSPSSAPASACAGDAVLPRTT